MFPRNFTQALPSRGVMAKSKMCPIKTCGYYMIAVEEKEEPRGSYVVYECRACGFRERVFEPK